MQSTVAAMGPPLRVRRIFLLAVVAVAMLLMVTPFTRYLDQKLLDNQFRVLRILAPKPALLEVVVVGIDEGTVDTVPEPLALWHRHFGKFFTAMSQAGATAVAVDLIFPNRSFDSIVPGYDRELMRGLLVSRKRAQVVLGMTVEPDGQLRAIYPPLITAAGEGGTGYVLWREDSDGVVRHFSEYLAENGEQVPTLVGQLARRLGLDTSPGIIDFSVGEPFEYIPLHEVLKWYDEGNTEKLQSLFAGKPVFLGSVLPFLDRLPQPIPLAAWEPDEYAIPGMLIHTQALRAIGSGGLIKPVSDHYVWLGVLLACIGWFLPARSIYPFAFSLSVTCLILGLTTYGIAQRVYFPPSGMILAANLAIWSRYLLQTVYQILERHRLRRAFGSYVSPQILDQIVKGGMSSGLGGVRKTICVLFADVRNFTTRSEGMEPEALIVLLNRYFEEVTTAIHEQQGTVDKFIGDGIMAFFGAPGELPNPSQSAFNAAKEMIARVQKLNQQLAAEGIPAIEVGIGLHYGDAVVGHVGSAARHEYTAIGDTVNLASRFESMTKEAGCPVVVSRSVAERLENPAEVVLLGSRVPKGHSAVEIYGWPVPVNNLSR